MTAFTVPGLTDKQGAEVAELLQKALSRYNDLHLTLKHVHWNVVGPNFIGVHEMIDPQYAEVAEMVDSVAERIATLGGQPLGTPGAVVAGRSWDDYSLNRALTHEHLAALDKVYVGLVDDHRKAIKIAGDLDPVTEDLLIGQTNRLELFQWFVRAHLEDKSGNIAS